LSIKHGGVKSCNTCIVAKAAQKNVFEVSDHVKSKLVGERIVLDLSSIKHLKKGVVIPKPQWIILVDEAVNLKICHWFAKKNDMVEPTCELIKMLGSKGIVVKVIRLDNAGENSLLEKRYKSKDWKFDITLEYTTRATP
jgi:hypothetical protein